MGLSAAGTAAVRGKRSSLRRHCRHTSNIPAVRHFAPGARSTSSGVVRGIPCNHTPAPPDLPSRGRDSGTPDESCNTALVDPPKATKGRRMSKKSRKKSSKTPSGIATAKKQASTKRATTKAKSAKTQRTPANKSTGTVAKAGSHKAASKQLNSSKSAAAPAKAKSAATGGLAEGQKAPAFRLPRDGGDVVSLADFAGRKLVLFFYPRADTPGCTKEAIDFTRLNGRLRGRRYRRARHLRRSVKGPGEVPRQARPRRPPDLGRDPPDAGGLWRLGRKIHVWQELPRNSSHHSADRSRRQGGQDLAQCPGRRPCRQVLEAARSL